MIWKWIVISHLRVAGLLRKIFAIRSEFWAYQSSQFNGRSRPRARNWAHAKSLNLTGWWFSTLNTRSIPQNHSQIMLDPNGPLNRDHFFRENSVLAPDRFLYFSRHGPWKMLSGRCLSKLAVVSCWSSCLWEKRDVNRQAADLRGGSGRAFPSTSPRSPASKGKPFWIPCGEEAGNDTKWHDRRRCYFSLSWSSVIVVNLSP